MKKTTKKLNIKKETVAAFTTMSEKEMVEAKGGVNPIIVSGWLCDMFSAFIC